MIEQIQKISDFGIFEEFVPSSDLKSFSKYNLIYGWNGSGKSTLSKLFYGISENKVSDDFPGASFQIKTTSGVIDSDSFSNNSIIKVFNDDFIKENIDWDNLVKSLLYVSKGKVEDKKKYDELLVKQQNLTEQINSTKNDIRTKKVENENFLTDTGKEIKKQFEVLKTDDSTYINYTKRNLRKLIDNHDGLKKKRDIVSEKSIEHLKQMARLEFLDSIEIDEISPLEPDYYIALQDEINKILKTDIVTASIPGLKSNIELNQWVEKGLFLHQGLKKCKFCGNSISVERRSKLNDHFSENYTGLKENLVKHQKHTEILFLKEDIDFLNTIKIYPFLSDSWLKEIASLKKSITDLNNILSEFLRSIHKKLSNPFNLGIKKVVIKKTYINNYNKCIENITRIINEHNDTTKSFHAKVSEAKQSLELFYAHKEIKRFKYFEKLRGISDSEYEIDELNKKLPPLETEIVRLEASLTDEVLGAAEFNTKLHRFLNHSDISLKFDRENKGYRILRKSGAKESQAKNLSEGEKTAISFVFFLTKLKENDEDLKNSIIIIDDPISSFDSNHLFNAYSYIRNICTEVKQLIILTHNFMFFRLIRDWMEKKNERKRGIIKSTFYSIQANYVNGIRKPSLHNADDTLMKYNSEYHYMFSKLYEYRTKSTLSLDECFLISNITRKVLEIFLKFKFPKRRNDFYALFNEALKDKRYDVAKERIYKFINKYSHGDSIESFDDTVDNIISESRNIVDDVLKIIKKLDQRHYEELIEIMN